MRNSDKKYSKPSTDLLGLDTETILGYCRLLCLSDGSIYRISKLDDVLGFLKLFLRNQKTYFMAWNADYDIQALLKYFPKRTLDLLMRGIEILYEKDDISFSCQYIKGKFFQWDGNYIFDAFQYYHTSLKEAQELYRGLRDEKFGQKVFEALY